MSPRLVFLLLIVAALASRASAAEHQIKVQWALCELTGDFRLPEHPRQLANRRGADLVSPPAAVTRSGERVELSVTRDVGTGKSSPMEIGVFLGVRTRMVGNRFEYAVDTRRVEYVDPRAGTRGVFEVRRKTGIKGVATAGESVVLDLGVRQDRRMIRATNGRERDVTVKRRLVAFLSFRRA